MSKRDWRRPIVEDRMARAAREARLAALDADAQDEVLDDGPAYSWRPTPPPVSDPRPILSERWSDARLEIQEPLQGLSTGDTLVFARRDLAGCRVEITRNSRDFTVAVIGLARPDELMLETYGLDWSGLPGEPAWGRWPSEPVEFALHRVTALVGLMLRPRRGSDVVFGPPPAEGPEQR